MLIWNVQSRPIFVAFLASNWSTSPRCGIFSSTRGISGSPGRDFSSKMSACILREKPLETSTFFLLKKWFSTQVKGQVKQIRCWEEKEDLYPPRITVTIRLMFRSNEKKWKEMPTPRGSQWSLTVLSSTLVSKATPVPKEWQRRSLNTFSWSRMKWC